LAIAADLESAVRSVGYWNDFKVELRSGARVDAKLVETSLVPLLQGRESRNGYFTARFTL
jgi:hypothetical protein